MNRHGDGWHHEQAARLVLYSAIINMLVWCVSSVALWPHAVAATIGIWFGIYIVTPDADLATITRAESRWFRSRRSKKFSCVRSAVSFHIGIVALVCGFWPGLLLRHRGISHMPIVGAVVIGLLVLASPALVTLLYITNWWQYCLTPLFMVGWAGFALAHIVHIICDHLW